MHRSLCLALLTLILGCGQAAPERRDPGIVTMDGALGNALVPAGSETEVIARLRIGTHEVRGIPRPPLSISLVVDTSGSMAGQPIDDARAASLALVDALADGDRLAVVVFHSRTEVLVPQTVIDPATRATMRQRLSQMEARGTTDMAGGLRAGLEELLRNPPPGGVSRLVLLGDGVPNDPAPVPALAQAAGERGIAITSLGLGLDFDETLMGDIAQRSGGRFHYVDDSALVAQVFREEVLRMQRVVGRNAYVTLTPGPGVLIREVVGQVQSTSGTAVNVTLGDLAEGETRDLVVKLIATGHRAGATVELLDATMGFDDAVSAAGHFERGVFLSARASSDDAEIEAAKNGEIQRAYEHARAAAVTVQAIALARGGELEDARRVLDAAQAEARQQAIAYSDDSLREQAEGMAVLSGALPSVAPSAPTTAEAAPAQPAPPESPHQVRRAYDDAMRTLGSGL